MKQFLSLVVAVAMVHFILAQTDPTQKEGAHRQTKYQETAARIHDLVHTKLDVKFDYSKSQMHGKAWITLKPHFYPANTLELDAKAMEIRKVGIINANAVTPLKYKYNGLILHIDLNKTYKGEEKYTIYIDYTAKPEEYKGKGSAAINSAKGLYFINPLGKEKNKPTQIWTQGETEATSVWCPTIDKPNQKTTQEISMTVPDKYVSLSNGKLITQKKNNDGTRTDTWKMDQPHAPYLFFMGVGDYAIIKDAYKGKEVSYYVEKEYAAVARKIFGNTPEMMAFFSKALGIDYPWVKYAQMTARDYVSGAMENTTATLHQESAQQDARQLIDGNSWESTIAHELFHQWFGNLVTTESWSNLTLNESFANYSEMLWEEYKYGKDAGAAQNFADMQTYLQSESDKKDLVRYYYDDKEAMFDAVSYHKGGRILHMLRNYVGDSAFYKALNLYLTTNKYKSAEAHQLRLAFEEITGKDLNWFWNQWYFNSGHPKLSIHYIYDENAKKVQAIVTQIQEDQIFRLPIAIDVYNGATKTRHNVWIENKTDTFSFSYNSKPDLVNVDADKILLVEKKDNKTLDNFIHQYKHAGTYMDRREAIEFAAGKQDDPKALAVLKTSLKDKYYGLRNFALSKLDMKNANVRKEVEPIVLEIIKSDPKSTVRANAIELLPYLTTAEYKNVVRKYLHDSSYSIAGSALVALDQLDEEEALAEAKKLANNTAKGKLLESITTVLIKSGDESNFDIVVKGFENMPLSQEKIQMIVPFSDMIVKIQNTEKVKAGVDAIVKLRDAIPAEYGFTPVINNFLKTIITKKERAKSTANTTEVQEQVDYINSKITEEKKGFMPVP